MTVRHPLGEAHRLAATHVDKSQLDDLLALLCSVTLHLGTARQPFVKMQFPWDSRESGQENMQGTENTCKRERSSQGQGRGSAPSSDGRAPRLFSSAALHEPAICQTPALFAGEGH